jgi:ABC-type multidrug transport system fused ATPase/permease subunit
MTPPVPPPGDTEAVSAWRRPFVAWQETSPFLGASAARLGLLTGFSLAKAVSEALVLVLVARVALALSDGDAEISFGLGPFGDVYLEQGHAVLVALVAGAVMLIMSVAVARTTAGMAADGVSTARQHLLRAFAAASWDLQSRERTGHLQELLTSYVQRISTGMIVVAGSLTAVLSLVALLFTALVAFAAAAAAMLAAVVGLTILLRPLSKITRRNSKLQGQVNARFAADVTEMVSITQEVRVFGVTEAVGKRMRRSIDVCRESLFEVLKMRRLVAGLYQSVAILLILVGLGVVVLIGPSNVAGLAVVVLLFIRAVSYGQQLQSAIQQSNEILPFLHELRRQEAIYDAARQPDTGEPIEHVGALDFADVTYAYGDDPPALADLTCTIGAGETVGVVGPSGSGKSTFVQLLLRLRDVQLGVFSANGRPVGEYTLASWYQRIAIVPQKAQLFEGTVAENIAFYRDIDRAEVVRAARDAQIHDEIEAMGDGYETMIAGIGGSVSGGQAQRICLARALVGSPDLIVLDEPTSALDVRSEAAVQRTLEELKGAVTLVIIAHRLSTLRLCDRIMVLEHGRLQAFDEPDRLLEQESFYREAFDLSKLS